MASDSDNKKDLTGILDLQKLQAADPNAAAQNESQDPFAVNELQAVEQVDHFDSIDQIGMMDHPEPVEEVAAAPADDFPVSEPESAPETNTESDQFPVSTDFAAEFVPELTTEPTSEPAVDQIAEPALEYSAEASDPFSASLEQPLEASPTPSFNPLASVKEYSERSQGKTNLEVKIRYPFHLKISGTFGPFERDKLLLFITENPIGLSSADLDMQIQSGRVFLPRISEYAAVKLVQELRDSGLQFSLTPSDQTTDDSAVSQTTTALQFHYQGTGATAQPSSLTEIPILSDANSQKNFHEIDQVSIVQYVRTEVLEIENSPIIQEVIERMTESLKQKARLKGGNALLNLKQEVLPLRLPSQYQISLKASVVKVD